MSHLNQLPSEDNVIIKTGVAYELDSVTLGCKHAIRNMEMVNKKCTTSDSLRRRVAIVITDVCANRYDCKECKDALQNQLTVEEKTFIGFSEPSLGGAAGVDSGTNEMIDDMAAQANPTEEDYIAAARVQDKLKL